MARFCLTVYMKKFRNYFLLFIGFIFTVFVPGCKNDVQHVPFPEQETEFLQPVSLPFQFSEPKKVKWEMPNPDSIKPVRDAKLDFNKLPFDSFDIGDFRPMPKPMEESKFSLNNLPDTVFDLEKLPSQKFKFKVSLLGQPIRTKALRPRIRDKATQSIYEYGLDQGLSTGGGLGPIFQDSRGFLWIGTANGLHRFDGENFELYTPASGLTNFNNIEDLNEDSQGQIWAYGTGIDVINLEQGIIKHLDISQGLISNEVRFTMEDSLGNIWVATTGGLDIIDPKKETLKHVTTAQGLIDNETLGLLKDDFGNFWIGTIKGVNIINQKDKSLKRFTTSEGLSNDYFVWGLNKDEKGRILISNLGGGIHVIDLKNGTLKHIGKTQGLKGDKIQSLVSDKFGHIWVSSRGGFSVIEIDGGKIRYLSSAEGLGSNVMDRLTKDNQGHIWMSCGYADVDVIGLNDGMFKRESGHGLSDGAVLTLFEDDEGRIWIVNKKNRFYIADPNAGTIKHIDGLMGLETHPSQFLEYEKDQIWIKTYQGQVFIFNLKSGIIKQLPTAWINSGAASGFFKDIMGNIWLWGDQGDGGVTVYNPRSNQFKHLTTDGGLSNKVVTSCLEDEQGNIWIATGDGVDLFDPVKGTIKQLLTGKGQVLKNVQFLAKCGKGKIMLTTFGYGIYRVDQEAGTLINFTTSEGLVSDQVNSIVENKGSIYVGTAQGLTILIPNIHKGETPEWRVKTFEKPQLFDHLDFNPTVILTKKGQIWWGVGADGILIMNEAPKDTVIPTPYITGIDIMEQPQYFSNKEPFQLNQKIPDTIWSISKDTFYLSGNLPEDTGYRKANHISYDDVSGPLHIPVNLRLPYNQNYIRFHFTGTHLGNPEKTRYRYILEGQDDQWSKITDQSFASYISLKPGNYIFKLASRGFNGLWSKPVEMSFSVTPPWWNTWWAYLLFIIFAGVIVWGGITIYRSNQVKAENIRLEGKVMERTRELKHSLEELRETQTLLIQQEKMASLGELTAGIAHEIQNPLNFVNNFSDVNTELIDEMEKEMDKGNLADAKALAKDIKENEQKIYHHGRRADAIVKGMLQHSRTSTGLKEPADINSLADEYLRLAYHGLRAKDKTFNAELKTELDKNLGKINIVPQDIGRVLLNLFNNAFYAVAEKKKLYTTGYEPAVSLTTKKVDSYIEIRVKDNGNGIPPKVLDKIFQPFFTTKPTGQGTGLGLSLSYDIAKAHGGELKVETNEGVGTEFIIRIPV